MVSYFLFFFLFQIKKNFNSFSANNSPGKNSGDDLNGEGSSSSNSKASEAVKIFLRYLLMGHLWMTSYFDRGGWENIIQGDPAKYGILTLI